MRLLVVTPTDGLHHSRTHRIAASAVERGHSVTVLARLRPGTARDEMHPAGYRVVRVPTSARGALLRLPRGATAPAGDPVTTPRPARTPGVVTSVVRRFSIPLQIRAFRRAASAVAPAADLVHAMAFFGIPVGVDLARRQRVPLVYDAGDIYLEARSLARAPRVQRALLARAERGWAQRADRVVTVNEPYAEELERRLRVPRPAVVMNGALPLPADAPVGPRFRERLGLPAGTRVVLYHGGLEPERGVEELVDAIAAVPRAALVLMGYGSLAEPLAARATASAALVHVLPPVPPADVVRWVAGADVVAIPIQPTTLNHRLSTPNKLFEAMAAGVPVVASDLPGMAPIVRETGCGVLVDGTRPDALAAGLRRVLDAPEVERQRWGEAGRRAAEGPYGWRTQADRLFDVWSDVSGQPW
jgi:glycosyltransferase involved in cell wall biosynthesis